MFSSVLVRDHRLPLGKFLTLLFRYSHESFHTRPFVFGTFDLVSIKGILTVSLNVHDIFLYIWTFVLFCGNARLFSGEFRARVACPSVFMASPSIKPFYIVSVVGVCGNEDVVVTASHNSSAVVASDHVK